MIIRIYIELVALTEFHVFNRRIPYMVALKYKNVTCAALLNPHSAEPIVWPSPLKFISELNEDAKRLLEHALKEANRERERNILNGAHYSNADAAGADDNMSEV